MLRKFACINRWSHFFLLSIIAVLIEVIICITLYNISLDENIELILVMLTLNIASMIFIALNMMAYIHYKSPHYDIMIDSEMIIVPKYEWIPDSHCIPFHDILYASEVLRDNRELYQIIYNGMSVIIDKKILKNPSDFSELKYYIKEEIL